MEIGSLLKLQQALASAQRPGTGLASPGAGKESGADGGGFGAALDDALKSVSRTQADAQALQRAFQAGDPETGLEQTMVAVQKSQIAFQAALTVRNRLVSAYTDIMNMQV